MTPVRKFWHWWTAELGDMVPGFVKIAFFGGHSARLAVFTKDAQRIQRRKGRFELPDALLHPTPPVIPGLKRQRRVDVMLPEHYVLRRRIEAPKKARGKLQALARLDLKRNTPIPDDAAIWKLGQPKLEGDTLVASQYVVKRSDLAALRKRLAALGMTVRHFAINDKTDGVLTFDDAPGGSSAEGRRWRRLNAALVLGSVAALGFVLLGPALSARSQLATLAPELPTLRSETVALRRELEAARTQRTQEEQLRTALLLRPRLVETIRDITVSLPDDTWLSAMSFTPNALTFSGDTSGTAADLVLGLSQKRHFTNPRLSGPVTRTNTGREKFEIAAQPGGAP